MAITNCRVCGVAFNRTGRQYACTEHKGMINKNCKECGDVFTSLEQHHINYCEACRAKPRFCEYCTEEFQPQGSAKISRFCSDSCSHKFRWHTKYYKKKGYKQKGESNNNWKGGIRYTYYRALAFEEHGKTCSRCGDEGYLVHHKDRDRYNNKPENLEVLCKRCHQIEHKCWLSFLGIEGIPR